MGQHGGRVQPAHMPLTLHQAQPVPELSLADHLQTALGGRVAQLVIQQDVVGDRQFVGADHDQIHSIINVIDGRAAALAHEACGFAAVDATEFADEGHSLAGEIRNRVRLGGHRAARPAKRGRESLGRSTLRAAGGKRLPTPFLFRLPPCCPFRGARRDPPPV